MLTTLFSPSHHCLVFTITTHFFTSTSVFINIDMYTGADVHHPGPDIAKPSVTGLVFSYDEGATRYTALTEIQQPQVEIIESLQKMME